LERNPEIQAPDPDELLYLAAVYGDRMAFNVVFNRLVRPEDEAAEPNFEEGFKLLKNAIDKGVEIPSYLRLIGVFYYEGKGTEPDRELGFQYLQKAADYGDWDAVRNVQKLRSLAQAEAEVPPLDGKVKGLNNRLYAYLQANPELELDEQVVADLFFLQWLDAIWDVNERDFSAELRSGGPVSLNFENGESLVFEKEMPEDTRAVFDILFPLEWDPTDSAPLRDWVNYANVTGPVFHWGLLDPAYQNTFVTFFATKILQLGAQDEEKGLIYNGSMEQFITSISRHAKMSRPLHGFYYMALIQRSLLQLQEQFPYNVKLQNAVNLVDPVVEDLQSEAFLEVPEEWAAPGE
jgi:hypothetical protein